MVFWSFFLIYHILTFVNIYDILTCLYIASELFVLCAYQVLFIIMFILIHRLFYKTMFYLV